MFKSNNDIRPNEADVYSQSNAPIIFEDYNSLGGVSGKPRPYNNQMAMIASQNTLLTGRKVPAAANFRK
jgi:hypothetical protein